MCLRDEIAMAIAEVEVAVNILNNCAEDLTDSAIFRLSSAEARLNALLARAKGLTIKHPKTYASMNKRV